MNSLDLPDPIFYNDFTDLAHLLLPPGYIRCDEVQPIEYYVHKMSYSFLRAGTQEAQALAPPSFHADPLVAAVSAGSSACEIQVKPQGNNPPDWKLDGAGHGSLIPRGYACDYLAPAKPQIRLSDNSLTNEPTATKTSFTSPVRIDRVLTGFALLPLVSTFVVLSMVPNFYIKTELYQGRVKLRLFYTHRQTHEETEAPASLTQWSILAGDGKLDGSNTFTPGRSSRFTVIQAVMDDPINWYWAYIIVPVPLMTAETFVARWNKA